MSSTSGRTHHYHADASAVGGQIERPFQKLIPVQAPLSLPTAGGHATARVEKFDFEGILSVAKASTQVSGSFDHHTGGWSTLASASLEGVNVLNVLTADRVVSQISTDHPAQGYAPRVSFVGTQFVNLRINGKLIDPVLDLGFCDQDDPTAYPKGPLIENADFVKRATELQQRVPPPPGVAAPATTTQNKGMIVSSLVRSIGGENEGSNGHVIDIPEFGRIVLGELLVDHNSFGLTMIRLELGCPVQGKTALGGTRTNGSSSP